MLGHAVGEELRRCNWVGIPFAGGMAEVPHLDARTINVNDLHRHVMNLAAVMGHPKLGPRLYRELRRMPFHPDTLAGAQSICKAVVTNPPTDDPADLRWDLRWAVAYFICAWMTRHTSAGTPQEFSGGLSTRWSATGGDSAAHYHGAIRAINSLRRTLQRCNFTTLDYRPFLGKCKDEPGHGIYCDPPFPGAGDKYTHRFTPADHQHLACLLHTFVKARVVVRYYDTPWVRQLYPSWTWRELTGRKQTNAEAPEVLIINGPSYASH